MGESCTLHPVDVSVAIPKISRLYIHGHPAIRSSTNCSYWTSQDLPPDRRGHPSEKTFSGHPRSLAVYQSALKFQWGITVITQSSSIGYRENISRDCTLFCVFRRTEEYEKTARPETYSPGKISKINIKHILFCPHSSSSSQLQWYAVDLLLRSLRRPWCLRNQRIQRKNVRPLQPLKEAK